MSRRIGPTEVAEILGLHVNTVKRLPFHELPFIRVSDRGDRRYRIEDVDLYAARHSGATNVPTPLVQDYLDRNGSTIKAAGEMARDLMRGDPETLRQGYTLGNALLAVTKMFGLTIIEQALVADEAVK